MIDENNFVSEIEKEIKNWNAEVLKFRIIAEVTKPDDQIEHYQVIEDIVAKEQAVIEKLAVFDESGIVDQTILKNEIENLQQDVEDAIEAARVKIN
ncbi:hypothetical protein [Desulfopila sp. IMCC35008]|uniref:hypothetical protein n=1 Tax=Desulfopila sp. IMCC35008 TaxID=2653858 RepID=UPI0013D37C22|nr:hypothetical protein [Desulfopila sp. IMCC35008]